MCSTCLTSCLSDQTSFVFTQVLYLLYDWLLGAAMAEWVERRSQKQISPRFAPLSQFVLMCLA